MDAVSNDLSVPLRRVVLTGSECTGKTTLARALAARYATTWSPEHARHYVESVQRLLTFEDVELIARGQLAGEDAARAEADGLVLHDTDLLSTVVYSRHYYGRCPEWVERAAVERRADLYLLHHPDVPWQPDGRQRDRPERRNEMHHLFEQALVALGARVVDVVGPWPERESRAVAAIETLGGAPTAEASGRA